MVVLLITGGYDQTIRFWDASSGMCYKTLQHPDRQVNALQIRPDKQYVAAAGNPLIRIYDVNSRSHDPVLTYEGHTAAVTALGFQRDGRWLYSSSEDGTVKIWDLRAPTWQRDYDSEAAVNCVALHPNQGELVSGDQAGSVRVWDLTSNKCSCTMTPTGVPPISSVSVAADASLLTAADYDGNVHFARPHATDIYSLSNSFKAHSSYILAAR